jgi:hypothetical protein
VYREREREEGERERKREKRRGGGNKRVTGVGRRTKRSWNSDHSFRATAKEYIWIGGPQHS